MSEQNATKYAIIKTGGKQYRVAENDVIDVELLGVEDGDSVEFPEVLFVSTPQGARVGSPVVANATVKGTVIKEVPGEKITSIKYKRSHNQYRKFGHRQHYSRVKITAIGA